VIELKLMDGRVFKPALPTPKGVREHAVIGAFNRLATGDVKGMKGLSPAEKRFIKAIAAAYVEADRRIVVARA